MGAWGSKAETGRFESLGLGGLEFSLRLQDFNSWIGG